jgi:hypothetical protein
MTASGYARRSPHPSFYIYQAVPAHLSVSDQLILWGLAGPGRTRAGGGGGEHLRGRGFRW